MLQPIELERVISRRDGPAPSGRSISQLYAAAALPAVSEPRDSMRWYTSRDVEMKKNHRRPVPLPSFRRRVVRIWSLDSS